MDEIKHPISVWSDINTRVLRAVLDEHDGALPVIAAVEPNNSVGLKAVMVLLNIKNLAYALGGTPADLGESTGVTASGYLRIGYLSRMNGKAEIHDWLLQQPDWSIAGELVADGELAGFRFEWAAPDPDDSEIPF